MRRARTAKKGTKRLRVRFLFPVYLIKVIRLGSLVILLVAGALYREWLWWILVIFYRPREIPEGTWDVKLKAFAPKRRARVFLTAKPGILIGFSLSFGDLRILVSQDLWNQFDFSDQEFSVLWVYHANLRNSPATRLLGWTSPLLCDRDTLLLLQSPPQVEKWFQQLMAYENLVRSQGPPILSGLSPWGSLGMNSWPRFEDRYQRVLIEYLRLQAR